jgi:ribose transport system permease protein
MTTKTVVQTQKDTGARTQQWMQRYGRLAALLVIVAVFAIATGGNSLAGENLMNVLWQVTTIGVMAMGASFVIFTGGIDLSVAPVLAMTGIITTYLLTFQHTNVIVAVLAGLAAGLLCGLLNGVLVTWFNITPFIVTLATMNVFSGATLLFSRGETWGVFEPPSFMFMGGGRIGPVPMPVIIFLAVAAIAWFVAGGTRFGRSIYALGGNEVAAAFSGINVRRMKVLAYATSGFCAGLSGVLLSSKIQQASSAQGVGSELDVIASVVVGGASLFGGEGTIIGTLIGTVLIGVVNNGLNLLNVSSLYTPLVKGVVILLAVGVDSYYRRRSR